VCAPATASIFIFSFFSSIPGARSAKVSTGFASDRALTH
jgi:hypothetical protein